jgi:hypothetical protein
LGQHGDYAGLCGGAEEVYSYGLRSKKKIIFLSYRWNALYPVYIYIYIYKYRAPMAALWAKKRGTAGNGKGDRLRVLVRADASDASCPYAGR